LGWKAMPFAREDLDSNFVSIGEGFILGDQEGAQAPGIGRYQFPSKPVLCLRGGESLFRGTALFLINSSRRRRYFSPAGSNSCQASAECGISAALTTSRAKRPSSIRSTCVLCVLSCCAYVYPSKRTLSVWFCITTALMATRVSRSTWTIASMAPAI
jgi:hypothetical protein